jgi:outer membrane protein TolC
MKANKYNRQQANLNEQLNDETIVYNICAAYYEVFVYREQIDLLQENLKSYEEQLRISRLGLEKGVVIEADVNKLQVNYNNTMSQLVTAESNLELSENQLKNAMGFPQEEILSLNKPDTDSPETIFAILPGAEGFQAENRTDYKISQTDITLLEIEEKQIKAGFFPKLSAYARYGANGFGDKLGETFSTLNDFSAIGLKLTFPVFDGFKRKAQSTQTMLKRENAIKNLELDKQAFNMEYRNNSTKMSKAQKSMEIDRKNIRLAQSVFSSVDLQYQKGVTDLTDWLNAQYALKEAQANYLNSLYNFCISGIDLEKSKGTLLQFYKSF